MSETRVSGSRQGSESVVRRPLRLGTRGSPLAMAQARLARAALAQANPGFAGDGAIDIVEIRTTGDRITDRRLADIGGKGLFTKELDEALFDGRIDVAVHSMKDVPTWLPDGIVLAGTLPREDPRDALFTREGAPGLDALPRGARLGTSSVRRQAMVLARRPDIEVVTLRGNVDTRLGRLADGTVDATLLAVAGLHRLGRATLIQAVLDPAEMLPACGQGAVGLAARAGDQLVHDWISGMSCPVTFARITAERAVLHALNGSCTTPVGVLGVESAGRLDLRAVAARPDGTECLMETGEDVIGSAEALGRRVGEALARRIPPGFFDA